MVEKMEVVEMVINHHWSDLIDGDGAYGDGLA